MIAIKAKYMYGAICTNLITVQLYSLLVDNERQHKALSRNPNGFGGVRSEHFQHKPIHLQRIAESIENKESTGLGQNYLKHMYKI